MHLRQPRSAFPVVALTALSLAVAAAPAQAAGSATATCKGTERLCEATFSLAGGASNKQLKVQLPGTNLKLLSYNATPAYVHRAYSLSGGRFALGGSEYLVTLNAVDYMPASARLRLFFGEPGSGLRCGNRPLPFLSIHALNPGAAIGCARARAVASAWLARFKAHQVVSRVTAQGVQYRCRLVPTLPQNTQCDGGGTRVKFSAPSGP